MIGLVVHIQGGSGGWEGEFDKSRSFMRSCNQDFELNFLIEFKFLICESREHAIVN